MRLWQYLDQDYSGKKSIIELSFNMAMMKDCIKPCSSNILRLEHAVAHAMGYIKLRPVFYLFWQTWQTESKNGKDVYYLLKIILTWKQKWSKSVQLVFCCIVHARILLQTEGWTDDEQCNSSQPIGWAADATDNCSFQGFVWTSLVRRVSHWKQICHHCNNTINISSFQSCYPISSTQSFQFFSFSSFTWSFPSRSACVCCSCWSCRSTQHHTTLAWVWSACCPGFLSISLASCGKANPKASNASSVS